MAPIMDLFSALLWLIDFSEEVIHTGLLGTMSCHDCSGFNGLENNL